MASEEEIDGAESLRCEDTKQEIEQPSAAPQDEPKPRTTKEVLDVRDVEEVAVVQQVKKRVKRKVTRNPQPEE